MKKFGIFKKSLIISLANVMLAQIAYPDAVLYLSAQGNISAAPARYDSFGSSDGTSKTIEIQHTNCRGQTDSNWINVSPHETPNILLRTGAQKFGPKNDCNSTQKQPTLTY